MYEKPRLQKFGTFRDLTQFGANGAYDGITVFGIGDGCETFGIEIGCPSAS